VEEVLKQMRDNGTVPDGTSAADYYSRMWENNLKLSEDRLISSLRDLTDAIAIMENSSLDQFREMYNKSWESSTENQGELYYVEIPSDEELAYWDGKLEDQPDHVAQAWTLIAHDQAGHRGYLVDQWL